MIRAGLGLAVISFTTTGLAQEWRPAPGPLATRWAAEVRPDNVHMEYPRPQLVRRDWLNLNGLWQFAEAQADERAPLGKTLAERILVPFPVESSLSGVGRRLERLWYRRTFNVPPDWQGRQVLLHFGAVDWEARVWVNGHILGVHRGGYDGFSFDITAVLKESGGQELIVGVFDPSNSGTQPRGKQVNQPEGIYYTPSTGIWQTVWLEPAAKVHVQSLKMIPSAAGTLRMRAQLNVPAGGHRLEAVASRDGKVVARGGVATDDELLLTIADPRLWSPDDPFLYDLQVKLLDGQGKTVDSFGSYFGLRTIEVVPDANGTPRVRLNGQEVFMVGPLDQGFWPDGLHTAPSDDALRYDLEVTKALGFNTVRKHVKVEPERWYTWCDRLGLLVWQDMPSGERSIAPGEPDIVRTPESAAQFEHELARLVEGRFNSPSVIMWVVFNEGWGQYDTARVTEAVMDSDPSRLVCCASGWNDRPAGHLIDMHNYPGPGAPKGDGRRACVLGEFGGLSLKVEGHTWADEIWGYRSTTSSNELTWRYVGLLRGAYALRDSAGLCACIYTQTTDVETEANGLLTYDRAVIKVDQERVAAANRGMFPTLHELLRPSIDQAQEWRYTTTAPADDWFADNFDDAAWQAGPAGFGTAETPGTFVRTVWDTPQIWLRREIEMPADLPAHLFVRVHHDEDVEIYVNGVLAVQANGYTTDYEILPLTPDGRAAIRPGRNLIAVHCRQTGGGQYIDLGIMAAD